MNEPESNIVILKKNQAIELSQLLQAKGIEPRGHADVQSVRVECNWDEIKDDGTHCDVENILDVSESQ